MGTNTSLSPLYAWAPREERASCSVPRNRGPNTTLLSSMSVEGMGPSLAVEGATNREVFETYVERVLAPTLRPGQVVLMDNLTAHKGDRVKEFIEERSCELLYLPPPYSPDFNLTHMPTVGWRSGMLASRTIVPNKSMGASNSTTHSGSH